MSPDSILMASPADLGIELVEAKDEAEKEEEQEADQEEALRAAEPVGVPGRHEDGLLGLDPLLEGGEEGVAPLVRPPLQAGLHLRNLGAALEPGEDV